MSRLTAYQVFIRLYSEYSQGMAKGCRSFPGVKLLALIWWLISGISAVYGIERPFPEDGGPTEISCVLVVLDLDEISDANQNFTVNVFTVFRWNDPREAHSGEANIKKSMEEVWFPNLIFLNRQRIWSSMGQFVEITPEGDVIYRRQFWGDFSQPMNLHDFPFDTQTFSVQVVSAGSEDADEVTLIQNPTATSFVTDKYSVADWKVLGSESKSSVLEMPNGATTSMFEIEFTAQRLSNHYVVKVIAPLLMIVLLSWVVFWLNPSEGGSQLGVAVTSFLTVIAYHVALSSKLPEISYLTRLDVFVFCGTILVFLAMIEVVVTTGLAQKGRVEVARWLDRVCRLVFPVLLMLSGCYAFWWH
ncbi:hypothetical protein [Haloferula sp.]|uniref:hypothetical protein n=1 Tax=Haloferula sp. TaxID=2497595 RepID=UPI00329FD6FA